MDLHDQNEALDRELIRLGLDPFELPGFISNSPDGFAHFLQHLQALSPGASWHDVFPDLPQDFRSPLEQLQRVPYRPLGPWDHQELPTAPALHVGPQDHSTPIDLAQLSDEMRRAGLSIHAVGSLSQLDATHAFVVLPREVSDDAFGDVLAWFDSHPTLEVYTVPRTGEETYPSDSSPPPRA